MENSAFNPDAIVLPPPTEVSPTPKTDPEKLQPQAPIVLNPGISQEVSNNSKRGLLSTFSLLLAGWFVGNLVILSTLAALAIGTVGATGLVKVPLLTGYLFGKEQTRYNPTESFSLDAVTLKIAKVKNLSEGQALRNLEFSQDEINALLDKLINNSSDFPIGNQQLRLASNQFIFTGNLIATNAPVEITGILQGNSSASRLVITKARFGKLQMPLFLASSIVDSSLSTIGLSLSGSAVPARSIQILDGKLILQDVVNQSD